MGQIARLDSYSLVSGDERLRDPWYGGVIVDLESARNHLSGFQTNRDLDSCANYSTVKTAEVTSLAPFGGA